MGRVIAWRKLQGFYLLFAIGAAFLAVRTLLDSNFRNSTLLYIAVPFGLSVLLHVITPRSKRTTLGWQFLNHLRDATIVFLATSALLFEGFLCVLMFMPIYYLLVAAGFLAALLDRWLRRRGKGGRAGAFAIPAVVLLLCMEGLVEPTTVTRYREATHVAVVDASVAELQANMARPVVFEGERHWFLSIFPLPTEVRAGTLRAGDVHELKFVYRRWFVTNLHEGVMRLRIAEVSPQRIRTEIVENTSYLSHYMRIEGTEVRFAELGDGRTRVSLTVKYHRLLDPYWYFGPMQQLAAEQSARYLIESIIARRA